MELRTINIILVLIVVILAVSLIPFSTITGNIAYDLDSSDPVCYFSNSGETSEIPMDLCCPEIQKQFTCKPLNSDNFDLKCYISESSPRFYLINNKAFNYCKKEGYDVKA